MAYLVITINSSDSIQQINSKCNIQTKPEESAVALANYITSIASGNVTGSITVVTRATDPAVGPDADPNAIAYTDNLN